MFRSLDLSRLITELGSPDALRRETAVARLAMAGARALPGLLALVHDRSAASQARIAAFEALEASSEAKGVVEAAAGALTESDDELALSAIGVLALAARGKGPAATVAFDHLAAMALARAAAVPRRLAALGALDGLPDRHVRLVYDALAQDPASRVVARVVRRQHGLVVSLEELLDRGLPDDPGLVAAVVREEADEARVTVLRRLVEAVRTKERRRADESRSQWTALRGQVHQHLAARESRIALYDLREALDDLRAPLPVGFLSAAAAIGDASCLAPIAAGWLAAAPDDRWWRDHLAEAFGAIVRREGLTRRHPVLRGILQRTPAAAPLVALARRS